MVDFHDVLHAQHHEEYLLLNDTWNYFNSWMLWNTLKHVLKFFMDTIWVCQVQVGTKTSLTVPSLVSGVSIKPNIDNHIWIKDCIDLNYRGSKSCIFTSLEVNSITT